MSKKNAALKPSEEQRICIETINKLCRDANNTAIDKGWWKERDMLLNAAVEAGCEQFCEATIQASCLALIASEVSEALEAVRHGNPPDDKVSQFSGLEAELADVLIRVFDMAAAFDLNLGEAVVAKMAMNATRGQKHGGKLV